MQTIAEQQYTLGLELYEEGRDFQDYAQAFEYLLAAAEKGHAKAQFYVGECYANGTGVDKDLEQAHLYYKMSASQGNVDAETKLARLLKDNSDLQSAVAVVPPVVAPVVAASPANVAKVVKDPQIVSATPSVSTGEINYQAGLKFYYGVDGKPNYYLAVLYFKSAVEKDHAGAQFYLGECYANGTGIGKDIDQACLYFQMAASQGYAKAATRLAQLLKENSEQQPVIAVPKQKIVASTPNAPNAAIPPKPVASAKPNVPVSVNAAAAPAPKTITPSAAQIKKTKQNEDSEKLKASAKSKESEHDADSEIENVQVDFSPHPTPPLSPEEEADRILMKRSVRSDIINYPEQEYELAKNHYFGTTDEPRNYFKAVWRFKRAEKNGHVGSLFYLGLCYANGTGVSRNKKMAAECYKLAAEKGHANAQACLGLCYETGTGIDKDLKKAKQNYELAIKQGHQNAKMYLERLLKNNPTLVSFFSPVINAVASVAAAIAPAAKPDVKSRQEHSVVGSAIAAMPELSNEMIMYFQSLQSQIQDLHETQQLMAVETQDFIEWFKRFIPKVEQFEALMLQTEQQQQLDFKIKRDQVMIDRSPKLRRFQQKMQQELCRFIVCYYLAPASVFKLEDNKKEMVISAMGNMPIAGSFLTVITTILSYANKKNRFKQINRLADLFISLDHISQFCCQFARQVTLAKRSQIEAQVQIQYQGWRKIEGFYKEIKEILDRQWKDLAISEDIGLEIPPECKLAVMDCAYVLQQVMSGDAKIDKEQELTTQFMNILVGKPHIPSPTVNPMKTMVAHSRASSTPLLAAAFASHRALKTLSPSSSAGPSAEEAIRKFQEQLKAQEERTKALEKQAKLKDEQDKAEKEALRIELEKRDKELKAIKERINAENAAALAMEGSQLPLLLSPQAKKGALNGETLSPLALAATVCELEKRNHQLEIAVRTLQKNSENGRGAAPESKGVSKQASNLMNIF